MADLTQSICTVLSAKGATDNNSDPGCRAWHGPPKQPEPACYHDPEWHYNCPEQHGPSSGMDLGHPHGYRLWLIPQVSIWSLLETWAKCINTDPSCGRTTEPDMVLGSILDPDVTMAPGGHTGHSDHHGPWSSMVLVNQQGPKWKHRIQLSAQLSVANGVTDVNTAPLPALLQSFGQRSRSWQ